MPVQYTIIGKVAIRQVTGELPRIGETLVTWAEDSSEIHRFKVIDIQRKLMQTGPHSYKESLIEVYIELRD